jgi:hypothetical protein
MIQSDVNRILLMHLRVDVIAPLNDLVEWDRYGIRNEDDSGFIFGWIKRDDGFYDFVIIKFWLDWDKKGAFFYNYDTSSKKYSKEIGVRLGSNLDGYLECRSASDFPEARLIGWQSVRHKPKPMISK